MSSFTPAKKCNIEAMVGSIILTAIISLQTYAQPSNNSRTQIATNWASPKIIYVNPSSGKDAPNTGINQSTRLNTITYARQQASPRTIIKLAPGTYSTQSGEVPLVLKPGVTLEGNQSTKGENIVINGGDRYISRTFAQNVTVIADKDSTISGVSISNPNKHGTAVWIESGSPILKNNTFAQSHH